MGTNTSSGVRILGVPVFANPEVQEISGMNVVYRWSMDGLKFCFLGEIDSALSKEDAAKIGAVDVLFLPVSGTALTSTERADIRDPPPPPRDCSDGQRARRPHLRVRLHLPSIPSTATLPSSPREALPAQQTALLFQAP